MRTLRASATKRLALPFGFGFSDLQAATDVTTAAHGRRQRLAPDAATTERRVGMNVARAL